MSTPTPLSLSERFERARCEAVVLTDHYRSLPCDDPRRPAAWRRVMEQTEVARQLLLALLAAPADR